MKRPIWHTSILLFLLCVLMRCAPIYVPTAHNIPMLSGKGEFQGSVGIGIGTSLNAQTAYAITDHVGVAANYLYAKRNGDDSGRKHQAGELALGYYTKLNERWSFEVFAGYGMAKGSVYDSSYAPLVAGLTDDWYEASGTLNKIYIQPSIGLRKNDFTWSFSAKLSSINASNITIVRNNEHWLSGETSKVFLSWVVDGQAPLLKDKIFAHYQMGLNVHLGDHPAYDYETFMGSIGLLVKLKPRR